MRQFLVINNIPTPYRTFMFNKMHEIGLTRDIEVMVAFQAERLADRSWSPDEHEMRFPHFFSSGVYPSRKKRLQQFSYMTFNSDILRLVASSRYDWVLLAPLLSIGSWAAALVPSGKTRKLLWSESNLTSATFLRGPARRFKAVLQSPFSMLVCPGQRAVEYVHYLSPRLVHKPVLWLPNIVDTSLFRDRVSKHRASRERTREGLGVRSDEILILGVGQMIGRKGYSLLIEAAARLRGLYRIVLVGDGPLRNEWTLDSRRLGLEDRVRFEGEVGPSDLTRYLSAADWFIHCALQDPSPLVLVEAAFAGLPLAVSAQTGNSPELVVEGANGFTFDAAEPGALAQALERVVASSIDDRRTMGRKSEELAEERFDPDRVVEEFFRRLLEVEGQLDEG